MLREGFVEKLCEEGGCTTMSFDRTERSFPPGPVSDKTGEQRAQQTEEVLLGEDIQLRG